MNILYFDNTMHSYLLFYAWVIRILTESIDLFIPKEIILLIINLCNTKIKFMGEDKNLIIMKGYYVKVFYPEFDVNKLFKRMVELPSYLHNSQYTSCEVELPSYLHTSQYS